MQVLITGGSGFIGQALCPALLAAGWQVSVVSRDTRAAARKLPAAVRVLADIDGAGGADAVINLAGAPLAGRRWNEAYKQTLRESRLRTTEALLAWMESLTVRPAVLVSGSAIGYYGPSDDTPLAETAPAGDDFGARLAADWEAAALPARALGVRTLLLRTGVVLGAGGGAQQQLLTPYRMGLGGPIGDGQQWFSWIHRDDLVRLVIWLLDQSTLDGPVNGTAPEPVRQKDFAAALGRALHRPALMPTPGLALKAAFGEMAQMLIEGQRVIPARAQGQGFQFLYPDIDGALAQILQSQA
ncbi:TIGR01777 family oxidoreductase [Pseudoxanthomonas spadix]|uniref:TIGR01777 family oxidoreductase n=1 Tax=Pseudoxanthomonas spadix TaxID=415229 RepID=UPI000EFDB35C|nr:TIGR01777 family oxidoreductase [Pseudoxanthomonas spadix]MBP3973043.1 TIGR01777 family oxidoreductase [Pseudoxanthomonas spadix]RMW97190.1 TIGR01777 family protein [Pseudoxanthomonas spadix]